MHPIQWMGITFRSQGHLNWFLVCMFIFGITVLAFLIELYLNRKERKSYFVVIGVWQFFGICYVVHSCCAILVTNFGKVNGPIYSTDCIWFNGVVAVIYFLAAIISKTLLVRKQLYT
jgi:hypothetical protein